MFANEKIRIGHCYTLHYHSILALLITSPRSKNQTVESYKIVSLIFYDRARPDENRTKNRRLTREPLQLSNRFRVGSMCIM